MGWLFYMFMGRVPQPEYDENGIRTRRVSTWELKRELDLQMLVGEEIDSLDVDDNGDLLVHITDENHEETDA